MHHYEARFLPPEEPAPDSSGESISSGDADALRLVDNLQRWAELQTGREGEQVVLPEDKMRTLLTDVAVGRTVEKIADSFDERTPEIMRTIAQIDIGQGIRATQELEIQAIMVGASVVAASLEHPYLLPDTLAEHLAGYPLGTDLSPSEADAEMRIVDGIVGALEALGQQIENMPLPTKRTQPEPEANRALFDGAYETLYDQELFNEDSESEEPTLEPEPEHVSWQDVTYWPAGAPPADVAEWGDVGFREDSAEPLRLSEIYPDEQAQDGFAKAEDAVYPLDILDLLSVLKPNQRLVVLGHCGFDAPQLGLRGGPEPYSFNALGKKLNVSQQRAERIWKEALNRLRKPENQAPIQHAFDPQDMNTTAVQLRVGDSLRTGRVWARQTNINIKTSPPPAYESGWWDSLKHMQTLMRRTGTPDRIQRGTLPYAKIYYALLDGITAVADELRVHPFQAKRTPYPKAAYAELRKHVGPYLTAELLEDFWNSQARQLLTDVPDARIQNRINPDRFSQLFSLLLADCIRREDTVYLRIPAGFGGRCGFLGAWVPAGTVIIVGYAGPYTGYGASGSAKIVVHGKLEPQPRRGAQSRDNVTVAPYGKYFHDTRQRAEREVPLPSRKALARAERTVLRMSTAVTSESARLVPSVILSLDEAAEYLRMTPITLGTYLEAMGLSDQVSLTPTEISELLQRWPELRRSVGLD